MKNGVPSSKPKKISITDSEQVL